MAVQFPRAQARHALYLLLCHALATYWPGLGHAEERLVFDATVAGKPVRLAFDTGASHSVLFRSTVERLGLKMDASAKLPAGADALGIIAVTCPSKLRTGGLDTDPAFLVMDVPRGVKPDVDGLLGWLPLRDNIIVFDGDQGTVAIGRERVPDVQGWHRLTVRQASVLQLEVSLPDGETGIILVDTGLSGGVEVPDELWRRMSDGRPQTLTAYFTPGAGLVLKRELWAAELSLGDLRLKDVPVGQAQADAVRIPGFVGLIGTYALSRLNLVVDASNGVAYVKPSRAAMSPYSHNRLGAVFVPRNLESDALLAHVVKGSPAERASIHDGDVLIAIEDLDVTRWRTDPRIMPLSRFFERPAGTALELTIEREGKRHRIRAVLEDILAPDR